MAMKAQAKPMPAAQAASLLDESANTPRVPSAPVDTAPGLLNATPPALADDIIDYAAAAGEGAEDFTSADIYMPYLVLCQSGTPFAKRSSAKYVEGAEEGDIISTYDYRLFKQDDTGDPVRVISCFYERKFVEYEVDEAGEIVRYLKDHPHEVNCYQYTERKKFDAATRMITSAGHAIEDIALRYVLVLDDKHPMGFYPCVIKLKRTGLGFNKEWSTAMKRCTITLSDGQVIQPSTCHQIWALSSKSQQKDDFSYYVMTAAFDGPVKSKRIAEAAQAFRAEALGGGLKPVDPMADMGGGDDDEFGDPDTPTASDGARKNIPF